MGKMMDYFYKMMGDYEIPMFLEDTLDYFASRGIYLKPLQLSCIIYIAAMEDMDAVAEIFEHLEEIHYRGEDES